MTLYFILFIAQGLAGHKVDPMKSDSADSGIEVATPTSGGSLHGGIMGHLVGPPSGGNAQQTYGVVAPQQQRDIGK